MISHLLDTCAILDLACGRWTNRSARAALQTAPDPVLLCVSVWEIARKLRVGKLALPCDQAGVLNFVREVCAFHQIRLINLDDRICHLAEVLPAHHEDPFDRMIIACAIEAGCPVFTTDRRFNDYPVGVVSQR